MTLSANFSKATWHTFIQTGVLYDVTLVCCDPFTETHGVVVVAADHWSVTAHVGGTVCSPWSIGCTSDVSLVCDGGPAGLMELL